MTAPTTAPTTATGPGAGRRLGPALFWIGLVAVLLVVALLSGPPADDGPPLDPEGTGPLGTRALVLLLEDLGADVDVVAGPPPDDAAVALVLADRFDAHDDDASVVGQLRQWVEAGGRLVVADPSSPLTPPISGESGLTFGGAIESSIGLGDCDIDALRGIERVDPAGGLRYQVEPGAEACFATDQGAFVVAHGAGRGTVVAVGGAGAFVNEVLGTFDNSVLAAALLVPPEGGRVAILQPPAPGSGDRSLADLVHPRVKQALWQAGVAFALYALWRARRLGRPVAEPQPVAIAGSELVSAVGDLLQQARDPSRAAGLLRSGLRRDLAQWLGLPHGAPATALADAAGRRAGVDQHQVLAALADAPVAGEAELVALARHVESIRQEVLHGRRP